MDKLYSNSAYATINQHLEALRDAGLVRLVPNAEKTVGRKASAWEWIA